jgi:hypothetical protein
MVFNDGGNDSDFSSGAKSEGGDKKNKDNKKDKIKNFFKKMKK